MLEDLTPPTPVWPCRVKEVAETLDGNDPQILLDAVEGDVWKINSLVKALRQKGLMLSDTPIAKHRRRECSCFRA